MVNFPIRIPDCNSHNPVLLDIFLSSNTSICSAMAFPFPMGNSYVIVTVSIHFPINSKLLLLVNFVGRFRLKLVYISLIVSIWSNLTHLHGFQQLVLLPQLIEIISFVCTKRIILLNLKLSSHRFVIIAKSFLKLINLHILLKQKSPSLSRNLALKTFDELLIVFSTKVNLLYLHYSAYQRCCFLHLIEQNYFLKIFLRRVLRILMTQVSLYLFFQPVFNIFITSKMVKNVTTKLDSSKASGPYCIPVVVLKNCEPEFSYILAELFNMCLKESCFLECWKVSSIALVLQIFGERSASKSYPPGSLLSVVSKLFEKLVNNRIIDQLEKCVFFLISIMVLALLD